MIYEPAIHFRRLLIISLWRFESGPHMVSSKFVYKTIISLNEAKHNLAFVVSFIDAWHDGKITMHIYVQQFLIYRIKQINIAVYYFGFGCECQSFKENFIQPFLSKLYILFLFTLFLSTQKSSFHFYERLS